MLPKDPPPIFGLHTHRSRVEHKLAEAQYFYNRLIAKDGRYSKLAAQKLWSRALEEMEEWVFLASAFISATRSVYYYLNRATKAKDENKRWLAKQEEDSVHEIGRELRDFMLHEATPSAGYQVDIGPPKPGENKGEQVARYLLNEPRNPRIQISLEETLPNLSVAAKELAKSLKTTALLGTILAGMEQLVSEARVRGMLSEETIGPGVSTKRKRSR